MVNLPSSTVAFIVLLCCLSVSSLKRPNSNRVSRASIDWNQYGDEDDTMDDPNISRSRHLLDLHAPHPHLSFPEDEENHSDICDHHTDLMRDVRRKFAVGHGVFPTGEDDDYDDTSPPISPSLQQSFLKTGTTIVGVATDTCVILASDTRATSGTLVADAATHKLHALSPQSAAAGAGTAADLEHVTKACAAAGKLYHATCGEWGNTQESANSVTCVPFGFICQYLQSTLYAQGGSCQAHLILGGFDDQMSPCLRNVHPHGSMDTVTYTSLGSGSMAALAVLEDMYRPHLLLEEAVDLAVTAVKAGIDNDMGSGSCVDVCILRPDQSAEYIRSVVEEEKLPELNEKEAEKTSTVSTGAFLPASGVNGFGNMDYKIQSRRTYGNSPETAEQELLKLWGDILPPP